MTVDRFSPWGLASSGTEHGEQAAFFAAANRMMWVGLDGADNPDRWAADKIDANAKFMQREPRVYELRWLHAVPNGGERAAAVAGNMKAEGVKSGVADIFLPVPTISTLYEYRAAGLYIEMKRKNGTRGDLSPQQRKFGEFVLAQGYAWCWCKGWEMARDRLVAYLLGQWKSEYEVM